MELVGRGEKIAVEFLSSFFPNAEIKTQVPLHKMLLPQYREELSERQQKESIDIVVLRKFKKPICVRIQDRHHFSTIFTRIDKAQRYLLEWSRCDVVDVEEYNCPELFKDKSNVNSREELKKYFKDYL